MFFGSIFGFVIWLRVKRSDFNEIHVICLPKETHVFNLVWLDFITIDERY